MPLVVRAVARSHVGLVRSGNEDSGYAGRSLFVIADGMGGHAAGEVASRTVVAALLGLDGADLGPDTGATLAPGRGRGQRAAAARRRRPSRPRGHGHDADRARLGRRHGWRSPTSATPAPTCSGTAGSRMITHDQTLVQALVDEGRITEEEARTHPQHAVILQAMDGRVDLEPVLELLEPQAGDRYLVCSDGLTRLRRGVGRARPSSAAATRTPRSTGSSGIALEAGAPDNVTVIVVDVARGGRRRRARRLPGRSHPRAGRRARRSGRRDRRRGHASSSAGRRPVISPPTTLAAVERQPTARRRRAATDERRIRPSTAAAPALALGRRPAARGGPRVGFAA